MISYFWLIGYENDTRRRLVKTKEPPPPLSI